MSGRLTRMLGGPATTPALSLLVVVVIAALSYLGVAAPQLLSGGRTATIHRAVDALSEATSWPAVTEPGLPASTMTSDADAGVWGGALATLERKRQEQPEPLRSLLGTPRIVMTLDPVASIDEDPHRVTAVPLNKVGLVSDPGLLHRSELLEGSLPRLTDPAAGIEIALTQDVAEQLKWPLRSERRWGGARLILTGILAPTDVDHGDWSFVPGSTAPVIEVDGSGNRILVAAAFMHADQAAKLADHVADFKVTSWMPIDTAGIDDATAEKSAEQLRLLAADPVVLPMLDSPFFNMGLQYRSLLSQAIDEGVGRADAMAPVVTVAAVGPVVVALVVLALLSRLIAVRRVEATRVLRARGASVARLVAMLGGEGAVLGVLGAAIGAGAAAAVPGCLGAWALVIPAVLAVVPAVAVPWGALTEAERSGRADLGEKIGKAGSGRLLLEILVLVVTAVLAVIVLTRGEAGGVDPLLLALLVLLGITGSILTLGLLPVLLHRAERRGARRASLSALLGPARARRDTVVRTAPVLGLVIGLGVAVFAVGFSATVSDGIVRAAAVGVGADLRVDSPYIRTAGAQQAASIDGVTAAAGRGGGSTMSISAGSRSAQVRVYTVDRDAFVAVQRGAPGAIPLPAALTGPADAAVPVVVSQTVLDLLGAQVSGDEQVTLARRPVRIVGSAAPQIPFGTAEQWLIVDDANADALGVRDITLQQLYFALSPDADPAVVGKAAAAAVGGDVTIQIPAQVAATRAADPSFEVVRDTLLMASGIVAVLLAFGVLATLMLGAPSRSRMLAILRTLGHAPRGAGGLVMWEVAPALLLSLPFGTGVGIAMAGLVIPQLDLRAFVGGAVQPPVVLGGVWLLIAVAAFALVAAVAILVAVLLASRLGMASAIRADERGT
jgi:putative ABC transport system permease protein